MDLKNYKGNKLIGKVKSGSSSGDLFIVVLLFFIFLLSAYYFRSGGGEVTNSSARKQEHKNSDVSNNTQAKKEESEPSKSISEQSFWEDEDIVAPELPEVEDVDREESESANFIGSPVNKDFELDAKKVKDALSHGKDVKSFSADKRSIESKRNTTLRFKNFSKEIRKIYWLDYEGEKVHYKTLYPDESYFQNTFMTHPWLVTDNQGRELGVYYPKNSISDVILEDVAATDNKKLNFVPPQVDYQQVVPTQYQGIVGSYKKIPYENNWHDVTVQFNDNKLIWSNKAKRSWQLHIKDDKLRTGRDCPYGVKDVVIEYDNNNVAKALWFLNERYVRQ